MRSMTGLGRMGYTGGYYDVSRYKDTEIFPVTQERYVWKRKI